MSLAMDSVIVDTMQNAEVGLWRPILKTPFGKVECPLYRKRAGLFPLQVKMFEDDNKNRLIYERVF